MTPKEIATALLNAQNDEEKAKAKELLKEYLQAKALAGHEIKNVAAGMKALVRRLAKIKP